PGLRRRPVKQGWGEPHAALRNHGYLDAHHGQPRPSSHQPDYTLPGPTPITAMQGQTTGEAPTETLDTKRLTLMCGCPRRCSLRFVCERGRRRAEASAVVAGLARRSGSPCALMSLIGYFASKPS